MHLNKATLAAHALEATPDDERTAVESHLQACAGCRAQLREFRLAAAELVGAEGPIDLDADTLDRTWAEVQRRLRHR